MNILLTPARIGGVEIKNRIIMPPMTTRLSDDEGHVTDDTIAYYMARVRGGVGMITVEMASPERAGRHRRRELGIYDDRFLPGLTRLVDAIHGGGAKASIQLGHGGGHTRRDICGETPVAPSAIPHPVYEVTNETIVPEAMTRERIAEAVAAFARAGARAQGGGLRLRRDPRRARLPDLAIRHAVREPAHRRIRRLARKPRALRPRGAARGEGRGRNDAGDLSRVGRRLFPAGPWCRGWHRDRGLGGGGGRGRAAHRRRALPFAAVRRAHDPADGLSRRDVPRLRRRGEAARRAYR